LSWDDGLPRTANPSYKLAALRLGEFVQTHSEREAVGFVEALDLLPNVVQLRAHVLAVEVGE
jgi:hypothetical protein